MGRGVLSVDNVVYRVTTVYRVLSRINVHVRELVPRNACISSLLRNTGDIRQTKKQRPSLLPREQRSCHAIPHRSKRENLIRNSYQLSIDSASICIVQDDPRETIRRLVAVTCFLASGLDREQTSQERGNKQTGERRRFRELELLLWRRRRWRKG